MFKEGKFYARKKNNFYIIVSSKINNYKKY